VTLKYSPDIYALGVIMLSMRKIEYKKLYADTLSGRPVSEARQLPLSVSVSVSVSVYVSVYVYVSVSVSVSASVYVSALLPPFVPRTVASVIIVVNR
jgi:hypothetical protein